MIVNQNLQKIFGLKYYDEICKYIESIQNAIDSYDIVIFMARKAYCFYKALEMNELVVPNNDCQVFSSRAVSFNNIDFTNKRVALFEDVVILGESLFEVLDDENIKEVNMDIFMLAYSSDFFKKTSEYKQKFFESLVMSNKELLEFATLITNYIIYEMVPYNTDFPVYSFKYSDYETLAQHLNNYNLTSITELIQCRNNSILEYVIAIDNSYMSGILPQNILEDAIFKIRIYIDINKNICLIAPIIIFCSIDIFELESIYSKLFSSKYENFINKKDYQAYIKSKLRIFGYRLSEFLAKSYMNNLFRSFNIENFSNEKELFSFEFENISIHNLKVKTSINKHHNNNNYLSLYNALGYGYDLLISNFDSAQSNFFKKEYISFDDIANQIKVVDEDPYKIRTFSSLILDIFIDNGVVVPRISVLDNTIKRVFKFGEVAKLTFHDFVLFAIVLGDIADELKSTLKRTEIEKFSVIFFREFNQNFSVESNVAESFRICYSKFGPRISSSETQYKVSQGESLLDILLNNKNLLIVAPNKEINIPHISQDEEYNKVKSQDRKYFAIKLAKLKQYFSNAIAQNKNSEAFCYINSYIRLLTLIAIGNKDTEKLLSLIAEVDLIKCKSLSKCIDLDHAIRLLESIIDGVLSGIWKYVCFTNPKYIKDVFQALNDCSNEDNALFVIDIFYKNAIPKTPLMHKQFFDEIGNFLIDVAIFYISLCKYKNILTHSDFQKNLYKYIFDNNDIVKNSKQKYQDIFNKGKKEVNEFVSSQLKEFDNISTRIIDKFHVLNDTSSLQFVPYTECFVLFDINSEKEITRKISEYRTYQKNGFIVFPVDSNNKKDVLNYICSTLDNVETKALYFSSYDENISLFSASSKFYGEKFLNNIHETINFIRRNINSTTSKEVYILPKTNIKNDTINTKNFSLKLKDTIQYQSNRKINVYTFEERETMKATNIYVSGDMITVETVYGDFNLQKKISTELDNLAKSCDNANVQEQIKKAKDAISEKEPNKFKEAIKWLGEQSVDLLKTVGVPIITQLISDNI